MKILKYKKEKDKYVIFLDNGEKIETYEDIILKNNLLCNKEIDDDLIRKLEFENTYTKTYKKLQKMIGIKLRSEKEIRDYLGKIKDLDTVVKEEMILDLKESSFIDDERYAFAYTNDKINLSLDGPYKIIKGLKKENIDDEIVNKVLELFTNEMIMDKVTKIVNKKCRENKKYVGVVLENKISNYLREMGYSNDVIENSKYLITYNDDIVDKEFEKVYKKYSKKLKGDALYRKIKQVLYSYGISSTEVDSLINELEVNQKNC